MSQTLISSDRRAIISMQTGISRLIVDRSTEAFDALIQRGDVEEYRRLMGQAWVQMGYEPGAPIRAEDRPTALDRMKTMLIHAYAREEHIPPLRAAEKLKRMLEG